MEPVDRSRSRVSRALLGALALCLLLVVLPSTAMAQGSGCEVPVVEQTTEVEIGCAGDLEDITGVDSGGSRDPLPPTIDGKAENPIPIKRCSRVAGTRSIRADNVDCATARSLAKRAGRRRKGFKTAEFSCQVAGAKVSCFRVAKETRQPNETTGRGDGDTAERDGASERETEIIRDGEDAGQVVIVRRGEYLPRQLR